MQSTSKPIALPRLAPVKDIAAETSIPYTTWRDIAHRGEIPVVRVGRAWYLDRADGARWIETRKERA